MKQYVVVITPAGLDDLVWIYDLIADRSRIPEVAWQYVERLRGKCEALSHAPIRGQRRDDIRPGLRILGLEKNAVVAFEVDDDTQTVTILNVFYGGRDYETLLGISD